MELRLVASAFSAHCATMRHAQHALQPTWSGRQRGKGAHCSKHDRDGAREMDGPSEVPRLIVGARMAAAPAGMHSTQLPLHCCSLASDHWGSLSATWGQTAEHVLACSLALQNLQQAWCLACACGVPSVPVGVPPHAARFARPAIVHGASCRAHGVAPTPVVCRCAAAAAAAVAAGCPYRPTSPNQTRRRATRPPWTCQTRQSWAWKADVLWTAE